MAREKEEERKMVERRKGKERRKDLCWEDNKKKE